MRRRKFLGVAFGAAAAWPLAAGAQEQARRVGVLMSAAAGDAEGQANLAAFLQRLQQLGWSDGSNLRIDARWAAGNADETRKHIAEAVALAPDVILASGGSVISPLLQATRIVPIVFTIVADPVGAGYIMSLARPGGNVTGLSIQTIDLSGKRLEFLREVVPDLRRLAIIGNNDLPAAALEMREIEAKAARWALTSPYQRFAGLQTSCPLSKQSRLARKLFMFAQIGSRPATGSNAQHWRGAHDWQRCLVAVKMSRREV